MQHLQKECRAEAEAPPASAMRLHKSSGPSDCSPLQGLQGGSWHDTCRHPMRSLDMSRLAPSALARSSVKLPRGVSESSRGWENNNL